MRVPFFGRRREKQREKQRDEDLLDAAYRIALGVSPGASKEQIREARRRKERETEISLIRYHYPKLTEEEAVERAICEVKNSRKQERK